MRYGYLLSALIALLQSVPALAFELKNPPSDERRLRIELEAVPTPVPQDFDKYLQELAAAAQRDARAPATAKDREKERQPVRTVNPMVLFRW